MAGFLKDATSRWLSRASASYRSRKARSLAERERMLSLLVAEPVFLALTTLRSFFLLLMFCVAFGIFIFLPVWTDSTTKSTAFASWAWPGLSPSSAVLISKIYIVASGMISIVCGFMAMSEWSIASTAYWRLCRQLQSKYSAVKNNNNRGQVNRSKAPRR